VRLGLHTGVLAEEVLFLHRRERRVRVRAPDHPELVGIDPELLLQHQAGLQRFTAVLPAQHVLRLQLGPVEVRSIPRLVVGELVVRRQEGVRLAVALDLRGLHQGLEARPHPRELRGERLAVESLDREHAAVAEVAVVRYGEHLGPRLLLKIGESAPQVLGVLAVELREGDGSIGHARVSTEDDVPVEVVAPLRGPLVADERGEAAGVVVSVGEGRVPLPGSSDDLVALDGRVGLGERGDDLHGRGEGPIRVPSLEHVVPPLALLGGQDCGISLQELRHQAVHLGVVGHHDPVQRPAQPGSQTVGRDDFLATGESEGFLLPESAHRARIHRDGRVQVSVAKEDPGREVAADVRRVLDLRVPFHNRFPGGNLLGASGQPHRQTENHDDHRQMPAHHTASLFGRTHCP